MYGKGTFSGMFPDVGCWTLHVVENTSSKYFLWVLKLKLLDKWIITVPFRPSAIVQEERKENSGMNNSYRFMSY